MKPWLFVWDFDWTVVNENSDPWVLSQLGARDVFQRQYERLDEVGFTKVMDASLKEAHELKPYTQRDIYNACSRIPVEPALLQMLKSIRAERRDVTSVIVSDANTVFINNVLHHHDCSVRPSVRGCRVKGDFQGCFEQIFTNPARYAASGALSVEPYVRQPHGCRLCPPNLCKGQVLERLRRSDDRVVYFGDGGGDYCPCTKLRSDDVIFARRLYSSDSPIIPSLLQKLRKSPQFAILRCPPHPRPQIPNGQIPVFTWDNPLELASSLELFVRHWH